MTRSAAGPADEQLNLQEEGRGHCKVVVAANLPAGPQEESTLEAEALRRFRFTSRILGS